MCVGSHLISLIPDGDLCRLILEVLTSVSEEPSASIYRAGFEFIQSINSKNKKKEAFTAVKTSNLMDIICKECIK
jgi:hypothetical protein